MRAIDAGCCVALGPAYEAISAARSLAPRRRLQHASEREAHALAPQLAPLAGNPDLVAALKLRAAVVTKLVVLDRPLADGLFPHRERGQSPVRSVNVGPVHLVGDLHPAGLGADLRTGQVFT